MKSNVLGFILGLIGTILGAILTFVSYFIMTALVVALAIGKDSSSANIILILQLINVASFFFAILSLCLYFKFFKFSAVSMFIATILYSLLYFYLIYLGALKESPLAMIIELFPAVLLLISALFNFKFKKINTKQIKD